MKLTFYATERATVDLQPNPATREWMDNTAESYAYRCLPLNIANTHGWSFHLPFPISVAWDGSSGKSGLRIRTGGEHDASRVCMSNFGHGILTFFIHGVFRTEPGWNLYINGAPNRPLDGLYPLHGVVETDWAPYSFTMNWQITRPHTWLTFPKDYPFCSVMPVKRNLLESVEPEIRDISDDPELAQAHETWAQSRQKFNDELNQVGSEAMRNKWQKNYYQGKLLDGSSGADDHIIKQRISKFKDLR